MVTLLLSRQIKKPRHVRIYICAISCARGRNDARLIVPAMYTAAPDPLLAPNCRPQLNQISTPLNSVSSSLLKISHVVVNDGAVSIIAHFNVHSGCKRSSQTRFFLSRRKGAVDQRPIRMRNIMCARGRNDARLIIPAIYVHCGASPIIDTKLSSPVKSDFNTPE